MEYYMIPPHLDNSCFGNEVIHGARFAIDMRKHFHLRIVAAEPDLLNFITEGLGAMVVEKKEVVEKEAAMEAMKEETEEVQKFKEKMGAQ